MILIDANLLLYAKFSSFASEHKKALVWLDNTINSNRRIGVPWESIVAFIRLGTSNRVFERPLSVMRAWEQVSAWLGCENVWIPTPTDDHLSVLATLIPHCAGESGLIHDAHLASIALCHGLTVYSADADFGRFPNVRWVNPLENDSG